MYFGSVSLYVTLIRRWFFEIGSNTARRRGRVCYEMPGLVAVVLVDGLVHGNVYDWYRLVWEHELRILRRKITSETK
jgi:hypothetical protein